ncbi:MAG: hypothetical protein OEW15_18950 [Nitrospirota bacterium]|nr:hypothetical protein [Nitrospirota bacterium]
MKKSFTDIKALHKGTVEIALVGGSKNLKFMGFKVSPSKPTDEQLAKINRFTRRPFTADELYVGQLRLSNNALDRDGERFHEEVLQRFVNSTLRKTMLLDHDKKVRDSAVGKYFDVELEKMPLQQAIDETREQLKLPFGVTEVWFHSPWFYIPRAGIDEKEIVKIDAGIYDFASIGFRAEKLVPIFDPADPSGRPLYWEYRGTGEDTEMTEGSLVYLGAQRGMAVKGLDTEKEIPGEGKEAGNDPAKSHEGGQTMKDLLERLKGFFGKTFSEGAVLFDEIKAATEEKIKSAVDAATAPLKARIAELEPLVKQVADLTPLANAGKAYIDDLVGRYVKAKAKLDEKKYETADTQDKLKKLAQGFDLDFLKSEVDDLEKRVAEKFPDKSELGGGGDPGNRDKSSGAGGKKNLLKPE